MTGTAGTAHGIARRTDTCKPCDSHIVHGLLTGPKHSLATQYSSDCSMMLVTVPWLAYRCQSALCNVMASPNALMINVT